jgi:hypothetical protein
MTHEDEFASHPLTSLQENLTAAATRIAAAIENARAARIPGIAELIDLRAAILTQEDRFKRIRESSI